MANSPSEGIEGTPTSRLYVTVWFACPRFLLTFSSSFFFFFFQLAIVIFFNCEQCICVLFTVPQITLFSNFFIKNGSYNIIYTFKNYFATIFSVSVFNFNKNKFNPNTSYILKNGPLDIRIIDKEPFSPLLCPQKIYKAICTHIPYPTLTLLTI